MIIDMWINAQTTRATITIPEDDLKGMSRATRVQIAKEEFERFCNDSIESGYRIVEEETE